MFGDLMSPVWEEGGREMRYAHPLPRPPPISMQYLMIRDSIHYVLVKLMSRSLILYRSLLS